jgi:osmotically-inducible protein OsmY
MFHLKKSKMKTDSEIQRDVLDELKYEPILEASEIGVAVKNGVVTLTGTVNSYWKKVSAEKAAKRVRGVKAVAQEIEVRLSPIGKKNDTDIAEAVTNALKWHSAMQDNKIKVTVEDGWVTLEGEVEWEYQKNSAETSVENLIGVKGVINNINVVSKTKVSDIKQRIKSALERNATIDADKIDVEISGDEVTLTGKVRSWAELKEAETAAWLAPGVRKVKNKIEVDTDVFAY